VIKLPQQYLSNSLCRSLTGNVLYKKLRKGKDRGRQIIISWINIKCDKCKKFIPRKRLGHITKNDGLILCKNCAIKHSEEYRKNYKITEEQRLQYNTNRRIKYGIERR